MPKCQDQNAHLGAAVMSLWADVPGKASGPGWVAENRHIPRFLFVPVKSSFNPESEKQCEQGAESILSDALSEVHCHGSILHSTQP